MPVLTPSPTSQPTLARAGRGRALARMAGASTMVLAALVLIGWTQDIEALKRVSRGFVAMAPSAAFGLALGSAALMLACASWALARKAARLLGLACLCLGLLTLVKYGIAYWRGPFHEISSWLLEGGPEWSDPMSPAAASCLALFGSCMALAEARDWLAQRAYVGLASLGLLIATICLLGYLFGAGAFLGLGLRPIAVHTAAAFLVLFGGTLALRSDLAWPSIVTGPEPAATTGRSLLLVALLLPVISAWVASRGELAGLYDDRFLLALVTLSTMVLLATLVLFHTRRTTRLFSEQLEVAEALRQTEARLRHAADEENQRKDEFLATLGHELRNPLAPIRAAAQILMRQSLEGPGVERIAGILERQVRHMSHLIDDLLDVSRISLGRIRLRRRRVSLLDLVEEAIEASRADREGSRHELRVTLPDEAIEVDADPTRLAQVVLNLLDNAAKFTPAGGRIEVAAEARGDEAMIFVRDTGVGIDASELPGIFGMFQQAGQTRGAGLGIGLALARALMELHGGRIEARSDGPGKGSEFLIALPRLAPSESSDRALQAHAEPPALAGEPVTAGLRVLLVDDNTDALETLATHLELAGIEVRCAADGPAGLTAAEELAPHAIVLDIGLPGMSGYEVAERLRASPTEPRPLLVALTGWGQDEDRRRAERAGFDRHFTKPIDLDVLLALLRTSAPRPTPPRQLETHASS